MVLRKLFSRKQQEMDEQLYVQSITNHTKKRIVIIEEDEEQREAAYRCMKEALDNLHISEQVHLITDPLEILNYGITNQPAYFLNGKMLHQGRMLSTSELIRLLDSFL